MTSMNGSQTESTTAGEVFSSTPARSIAAFASAEPS